eukprot:13155930-Ditylum_brightwellii.AAC.1
MDKYDCAYGMYQEVLSIKSYHFGVSHPEVAVTLHSIVIIERRTFASRKPIWQKLQSNLSSRTDSVHTNLL